METVSAARHILIDLACPHCHKMNLLAVVPALGANGHSERDVECAHCKRTWQASLPGAIMAGPFPR